MTKNDKLYKELVARFGKDEMVGIDRLLEQGHTGIAERHAVQKLVIYLRALEEHMGIRVQPVENRKMYHYCVGRVQL